MESPSAPVLPISDPQTTTIAAAATSSDPPSTTPSLRVIITNLSDSLRRALTHRRPWSEVSDRTAFSKPQSFSEATLRIRKNFPYFRVNYYAVVSVVLLISLLTNPSSLILLLFLLSSWLFLYLLRPSDTPLVLLGRTFSDFETLSLLTAITIFVVFLTSVGSVIVSALLVGVAAVLTHAAFRVPEDLFLDEQEGSQGVGLLSLLRGAAVNAAVSAATAPPAVSARG